MEAGLLRHRITIEEPATVQDVHGDLIPTWRPWATKVPAEIKPIRGTEFLAGQGITAQVIARIRIRWRRGLVPTMRLLHVTDHTGSPVQYDIYNIEAILPDEDSGRDYVWMMCSRGVNEG